MNICDLQPKIMIFAKEEIIENIKKELSNKFDEKLINFDEGSELTERETSVLKLVAKGKTNKEISKNLKISEHTVKAYISHILRKLGVEDRTQAAVKAIQCNIL